MTRKVIAIKQGMDLQAPHQAVGGGELGHIRHVDCENGLRVCINVFSNNNGERGFGAHVLFVRKERNFFWFGTQALDTI